jgi:hypothetical protein
MVAMRLLGSLTLVMTSVLAAGAAEPRVALDRGWRFVPGDDLAFARPGHWNDPDMLVVGWVGWGPALHHTALTPDEQYTHISLWSLLSAPLLIGCDLARLDPFTLNLLTNDEVLALDQDRLGRQATPRIKEGDVQVWLKDLADGLFTRSHIPGSQRQPQAARRLAARGPGGRHWTARREGGSARRGPLEVVRVSHVRSPRPQGRPNEREERSSNAVLIWRNPNEESCA